VYEKVYSGPDGGDFLLLCTKISGRKLCHTLARTPLLAALSFGATAASGRRAALARAAPGMLARMPSGGR
jgi:hypothetical protein